MFGGGSVSPTMANNSTSALSLSPSSGPELSPPPPSAPRTSDLSGEVEKRNGNVSPLDRLEGSNLIGKKRRSSGVGGKASSLLASAKNSLNFGQMGRGSSDAAVSSSSTSSSPLQKMARKDSRLAVPHGQHNNSAGESLPGLLSTFRIGVWEDRNRKCRRTMEDTHAFLYNFLNSPTPGSTATGAGLDEGTGTHNQGNSDTDNGYFAIFDGHAGNFAADWCGKKLHVVLEETIRKHPNVPVPELLDQTFSSVDAQLEKLPVKSSGCTAAIAVLRWEDRISSDKSASGSQPVVLAPSPLTAKVATRIPPTENTLRPDTGCSNMLDSRHAVEVSSLVQGKNSTLVATIRQRILYTANVGDARIILCRSGKALRLSYDHKGSDEHEGKRITNAGGLILNNRVNGVLAVTRALGDAYMKDLVTGHPYTTETVIQPESDEFIIIACDGLWDVCDDQEAVDLVHKIQDPFEASKLLVDHALGRFSTDNLSCMIVRFDRAAMLEAQTNRDGHIGVDGDRMRSSPSETSFNGAAEVADRAIEIDPIGVRRNSRTEEKALIPGAVGPKSSGRDQEASTPTPKVVHNEEITHEDVPRNRIRIKSTSKEANGPATDRGKSPNSPTDEDASRRITK